MQITETSDFIPTIQPVRESTRIINRSSRSGKQQIFDNGFGKRKNTDFEPLHYQDT